MAKKINNDDQFNLFSDKYLDELLQKESQLENLEDKIKKLDLDNKNNDDNELDLTLEEFKYVYNARSTVNSSQTSAATSNNNRNNQQQISSRSSMDDNRPVVHTNTAKNESSRKPWRRGINDRSNATTRNRTKNINNNNSIRYAEERNSGNGNITNERHQHKSNVSEKILTAEDYIINDGDLNVGGAKSKFKYNIDAIKTLNKINTEKREATLEEKQKLIKYSGWGGIPQVFDPINKEWKSEFTELTELLPTDLYQAAKRSTQDAHYTNSGIIKSIYKGLQRLGFNGGKVLEPAAGIGNFVGLMPQEMKMQTKFTCIEMDPLSYQIGELLYPQTYHINKPFQDVIIRRNSFDAIVGNPPYGNQRIFDINHPDLSNVSIHNYFIAKSLDKLKEGGVFGVVVSKFFLDGKDTTLREKIAEQANFLGAIRLPNGAFKENAMAEVTTDIVFFQKLKKGQVSNKEWIGIGEIKDWENNEIINVNEYYAKNPEQMIGKMKLVSGLYRNYELVNDNIDIDIEQEISSRLNVLPQNIYSHSTEDVINNNLPQLNLDHLKVGSYFITPAGYIAEKLPDELDNSNYALIETKNNKQYYRIVGMINIRDLTKKLIDLEKNIDSNEIEIESTRKELNFKYDRFIKEYGYLNSQINVSLMKNDTEHALLIALEKNYNKGISSDIARKNNVNPVPASAEKSDIFIKRVIYPERKITKAENAYDAYTISMNKYGKADLQYMQTLLTGMTIEDIKNKLKGHIFLNPANLEWESATKYLSGNVKEKLQLAEQKAITDPIFYENIDALREIIPADVEAVDIAVQLGSTWIPAKYIKKFASDLLDGVTGEVNYSESIGKWICKLNSWDYTKQNITYGSTEMGATSIIERILTNKKIEIKEKIDKDEKPVVNEEKTAEVLQKAELIKQEFVDWVWKDEKRRKHLTEIYNERFNHTVPPKYENSPLKLNNINKDIKLRKNQLNAIFRFIESGGGLLDHTVGAGKTYTMLAIAIESKRMGLANKPMLVVPNHLLAQWMNEAKRLYPSANLLIANKEDFTKERRQRLFANIATNDWDAIIISHSSLKKIAMPKETLKNIVEEQVNDITDAIATARNEENNRITVKEMEKMRERLNLKMQKQADAGNKDEFIYFDQLGIDQLFVDELQEFKNLQIVTSLNNIAGLGNITGSDKAFDLFVKVRYLQEKYGKGFYGGTGTPISNTIAEVYTLQRYFQYDELKKAGLHHFDAWASTFGSIETSFELDSTGVNYKLTTRFSKFQNVPELISQYKTHADTVLLNDLQKQEKSLGNVFPIPKIKGGRPQNIIVERSPLQEEYIGKQVAITDEEGMPIIDNEGNEITKWNKGSIIYRMEHIPMDKRLDNALKITSDARKAGLDMRLIAANAPDYEGSKINKAVDEIYRIYNEWKDEKGTQLVFCDLSTPKNNKSAVKIISSPNSEEDNDTIEEISLDDILSSNNRFSVYDDVKTKLIAKGIPEDEIAFIHDANTDIKKEKLFKNVNNGEIRILIGSTTKMGAGTNVQQRLVALHHLDCPWRPSDLEQREGRIIRQGNLFFQADPENFEVEILRYATKQTYDSRQWQTIETKARSIEQFRKGSMVLRTIEDISGEAANAAEMKAAASGNPLILTQVNIASELKKMEALYSSYIRNQHFVESTISKLEKTIQQAPDLQQKLMENIELSKTPKVLITENGNAINRNEGKELHKVLINSIKTAQSLATSNGQLHSKVNLGTYRGFKISVRFNSNAIEFGITGQEGTSYPTNLKYDRENPLNATGFFVRVDNYIDSFSEKLIIEKERNIDNIKKLNGLRNEIGKPFDEIELLTALREDNINVIKELRKMQKEKDYISKWTPSYLKISKQQDNKEYKQETIETTKDNIINKKRLKP